MSDNLVRLVREIYSTSNESSRLIQHSSFLFPHSWRCRVITHVLFRVPVGQPIPCLLEIKYSSRHSSGRTTVNFPFGTITPKKQQTLFFFFETILYLLPCQMCVAMVSLDSILYRLGSKGGSDKTLT